MSSLAASSVSAHSHDGGKCPVTGATGASPHAFCPPQEGDSRAPCPAMNSMANHGYLPRDGKAINAKSIIAALMECFQLSKPLAWFLTHGALTLLNQGSADFQLSDLARHNHVEHNGSLYHQDAAPREEYAPIHGDPALLDLLFKDSADGLCMTPEDLARVRVRREATSHPPLDFIHAELARGEVSIVLNMFNNPDPELHAKGVPLFKRGVLARLWRKLLFVKDDPATTPLDGVPIERLRYWFEHERLPEGWKPYHKTTLRQTTSTISRMRSKMYALAAENKKKAEAEAKAKAKGKSTLTTAIEVESAKATTTVQEVASSDDGHTLAVPPLVEHSPDSSMSSATSSTFSDVLRTPRSSEFVTPPAPAKDAIQVHLPEILERMEPIAHKVAPESAPFEVVVAV